MTKQQPKPKYLPQRAAWLLLARELDEATCSDDGIIYAGEIGWSCGLCGLVSDNAPGRIYQRADQ